VTGEEIVFKLMRSNQSIDESVHEPHLFEGGEPASSKWVKVGAIACALAVAVALLVGYRFLRARQLERVRAAQQTAQAAKIVGPRSSPARFAISRIKNWKI
jgi:hypothetical protein